MDRLSAIALLRVLIAAIAGNEASEVDRITTGRVVPAADIFRTIAEYGGGSVLVAPERVDDFIRLICEDFTPPRMWYIEADLWTDAQGRSDLSMRVKLWEADGQAHAEIQDLLVP
jgi:hypothetical protein